MCRTSSLDHCSCKVFNNRNNRLAIGCSLRISRVGALVPERVRKLAGRVKGWYRLRQSPPAERKIAVAVYGFSSNVGAVGTTALLDVPKSLYMLFCRLEKEGYDLGGWACATVDGAGSIYSSETLIAALGVLSEEAVISVGAKSPQDRTFFSYSVLGCVFGRISQTCQAPFH